MVVLCVELCANVFLFQICTYASTTHHLVPPTSVDGRGIVATLTLNQELITAQDDIGAPAPNSSHEKSFIVLWDLGHARDYCYSTIVWKDLLYDNPHNTFDEWWKALNPTWDVADGDDDNGARCPVPVDAAADAAPKPCAKCVEGSGKMQGHPGRHKTRAPGGGKMVRRKKKADVEGLSLCLNGC